MLIADLREPYLARLQAERGPSPSRIETVDLVWRHLARHGLGAIDASALTSADLLAYVAARRGEGVRGQTIRREMRRLRAALYTVEIEPAVRWPRLRSDPPRSGQAGRLHHAEDVRRWLDHLRAEPARRAAWLQAEVVARTGLRATEARRLRWSWVDEPAGVIRVPAGSSKTRSGRVVALTAPLLAVLREARRDHGDGPLIPGDHRSMHATAARELGLSRISLRDLRHCYASWATRGDLLGTREALGHTDLTTTSRYAHALDEGVLEAGRAAGRALDDEGVDPVEIDAEEAEAIRWLHARGWSVVMAAGVVGFPGRAS